MDVIEGIDTSFSVMAVTPQTPKCHHNRGADDNRGGDVSVFSNFYSILVPQN